MDIWLQLSSNAVLTVSMQTVYAYRSKLSTVFFHLYVVFLTTLLSSLRLYSVEWRDYKQIINWKWSVRKQWWPSLRQTLSICLEGLRKTKKNLILDRRYPGRDLNLGPPEYKAGMLTTWPRRSVFCALIKQIMCQNVANNSNHSRIMQIFTERHTHTYVRKYAYAYRQVSVN
jgi:hypothetical protein